MEKSMLELMQDLYLADNWNTEEIAETFRSLCRMFNIDFGSYTSYEDLYDELKEHVLDKAEYVCRFDSNHVILTDGEGTYALEGEDIYKRLEIISTSDNPDDFEDFRTEYEQYNTKTASLLVLRGADLKPKQDGICAVLRDDANSDLILLEQNITKAEQVEKIWEQMKSGITADLHQKVEHDIFGKFLYQIESDSDLDHEGIQAVIDDEINA